MGSPGRALGFETASSPRPCPADSPADSENSTPGPEGSLIGVEVAIVESTLVLDGVQKISPPTGYLCREADQVSRQRRGGECSPAGEPGYGQKGGVLSHGAEVGRGVDQPFGKMNPSRSVK